MYTGPGHTRTTKPPPRHRFGLLLHWTYRARHIGHEDTFYLQERCYGAKHSDATLVGNALSPLACNPFFVYPSPQRTAGGSEGRFLLACLFEYMFPAALVRVSSMV